MIKRKKYSYGDIKICGNAYKDKPNIYIGKYCSIGSNCVAWVGGTHRIDYVSTFPFASFWKDKDALSNCKFPKHKTAELSFNNHYSKGPIIIGNDVYIGANVTLMNGIKILYLKIYNNLLLYLWNMQ